VFSQDKGGVQRSPNSGARRVTGAVRPSPNTTTATGKTLRNFGVIAERKVALETSMQRRASLHDALLGWRFIR